MEKNIYDRQINKQGISDRIVDELNPQNLLERKQVDMLLCYEVKCVRELCCNLVVFNKQMKWSINEGLSSEHDGLEQLMLMSYGYTGLD